MFKKFLILIFAIFLINLPACADVFNHPQKLSVIIPQMPELNSINCKFKQEKTIPNSTANIKSSGDFRFIKNKGVVFNTTYPLHSTTSYNTTEYRQVNEIVNAISNKSYSKIERVFNFYFTKNKDEWQLGLIPKKKQQAAKYLASVEIHGKSYITQMIIKTTNSTKTTIWFSK